MSPRMVHTWVVKKSAAAIVPRCTARNVRHDSARSGTGLWPRNAGIGSLRSILPYADPAGGLESATATKDPSRMVQLFLDGS
jgi:hypothetical protein